MIDRFGLVRVELANATVMTSKINTGNDPRSALQNAERPMVGQAPYVVTIQRDGTWYPSLVFTLTDWMLNRAEREHP